MTILETGKYIKQLFQIKICKDGAAAPAGKRYGIEAYLSAESNHVQLDPDRSGEMVSAGQVIHADETHVQVLHENGRDATAESKSANKWKTDKVESGISLRSLI